MFKCSFYEYDTSSPGEEVKIQWQDHLIVLCDLFCIERFSFLHSDDCVDLVLDPPLIEQGFDFKV